MTRIIVVSLIIVAGFIFLIFKDRLRGLALFFHAVCIGILAFVAETVFFSNFDFHAKKIIML